MLRCCTARAGATDCAAVMLCAWPCRPLCRPLCHRRSCYLCGSSERSLERVPLDLGDCWFEFSLRDLPSTAEVQQQPCLGALRGRGIYYPLPVCSPAIFLCFLNFLCSPMLVFQSRCCLESSHCSVTVAGLQTQGKEEFSSHHKRGRSPTSPVCEGLCWTREQGVTAGELSDKS